MNLLRHLVRIRGHTLYDRWLDSKSVVVDAGAHRGQFSSEIYHRYGCQPWLVEANHYLAQSLIETNGARVIDAALGAVDGTASFFFQDNQEAGGICHQEVGEGGRCDVEVLSLGSLMERIGANRLNLLKLDIEGAEFELIEKTPDCILRSIDQISIEFHDFLPVMKGRGLFENAEQRLADLGFYCCNMAFRTHGDVLFLNSETSGLTHWDVVTEGEVGRWVLKINEMLGRLKRDSRPF